jgi:hypothetical protein
VRRTGTRARLVLSLCDGAFLVEKQWGRQAAVDIGRSLMID